MWDNFFIDFSFLNHKFFKKNLWNIFFKNRGCPGCMWTYVKCYKWKKKFGAAVASCRLAMTTVTRVYVYPSLHPVLPMFLIYWLLVSTLFEFWNLFWGLPLNELWKALPYTCNLMYAGSTYNSAISFAAGKALVFVLI